MLHMNIGMCEISHTSEHNFTFVADTAEIRPTFGTNDTSGIIIFTYLHPEDPARPQLSRGLGTESTREVKVFSNADENTSFDVDFIFSFEFEDHNSTIVNKTATLQVFEIGVECLPENPSEFPVNNSVRVIYSEINCTFSRMNGLVDEPIFIDLHVRPSYHLENNSFNLTGTEEKSIRLFALNSTPEDLLENYSNAMVYLEAYLIRNNSTIQLGSYRYGLLMASFHLTSVGDVNLGGVDCEDAAIHMGAMAFLCLFEGTSSGEDRQTNSTIPDHEPSDVDEDRSKSSDDEPAMLPGFLAINALLVVSMAAFVQSKREQ